MSRRKYSKWTPEKVEKLRTLYPTESREKIIRVFHPLKWGAIVAAAGKHGIKREAKNAPGPAKRTKARPEFSARNAGQMWTTGELDLLAKMIEGDASPDSLCLRFDRPLKEILDEADRIACDPRKLAALRDHKRAKTIMEEEDITGTGNGGRVTKKINAEVYVELDVVLKIRSIKLEQ